MAEYVSMIENGNYELRFETKDYDEFKTIESAMRSAMDSHHNDTHSEESQSKPKIKALFAEIVVHFPDDKPYYEILYYDTADNAWHTGYSSYNLGYVVEWLKTEFEISKANIEPVKNGHWIYESLWYGHGRYRCSECGAIFSEDQIFEFKHNKFCGDCGARMCRMEE